MASGEEGQNLEEDVGISQGGGGVIIIGRRKYAVGLSWQLSPTGRINQAAREAARESRVPMDFFAVRPGNKAGRLGQFGLSVKSYGHKAGMPSAAVSLASDQPGAWAGAFRLPEGLWVCVCRDDLITPDGDLLYTDETQAREKLVAEINLGGLQQIYAPEEWHLPGSDSIPLPLLLKNRAEAPLRAVRFTTTQIGAGLGFVVLLGLAWMFFSWQQEGGSKQAPVERPHEQASVTQMHTANVIPSSNLLPTATVPQAARRLWEDTPVPMKFMQICQDTMRSVPAIVVGWRRGDMTCSQGGLSVTWRRGEGPGDVPPNMSGSLRASDTSVTSTYSFPGLDRRGSEQLLDPADIAKMAIRNNWPAKLSPLPDDPLPPQPDGSPTPPPPWIKEKITISGDTAPWTVQEFFDGVPGLVIQSIKWSGKTWTTEGTIYENRK